MVDQRSDLRALASLQPRSPSITEYHQHFIPLIILSSPRRYQFAGCHNAIFWGRGLTGGSENMRRRRSHRLAGRRKLGQTRVFLPRPPSHPHEPWELARRDHGKATAKHPVSDVELPRTSAYADPIGDDDSTGDCESQGEGQSTKGRGWYRTIGWKSVVTHLVHASLLFSSLCTICDRPVFTFSPISTPLIQNRPGVAHPQNLYQNGSHSVLRHHPGP